jgi:YVTN family beta-propeller protein
MARSLVAVALLVALSGAEAWAQQHTVIALSHSDNTAYELSSDGGSILHRFTAENQPHEAIVSPDGRTVFVAIPGAGHVVILDATDFREKGKIESPYFRRADGETASPHGIAITSDGGKVYIGNERADVPSIVVYDVRAGRVTGEIDVVLEGGHFLAIDQRTDKLYYPMRTDNRVLVIDTRTDIVEKIIPVEGGPVGVAFTPAGEAWIHSDYDGSVTVIDTRTNEVVHRMTNLGTGAGRIATSPDGRYAASTRGTSADVALIDIRTRQVVARVPVGGLGFPLFSPDGTKLYVMTASTYAGTPPSVVTQAQGGVTVIDVATRKAVARYPAGVNPFGGDIRYVGGRTGSQDPAR